MEWIALKHALLSHLPVATGLLLPWALIAAQRRGRGIRPWWMVCRYLGWAGLLGLLGAFASGFSSARLLGLIPVHRLLPPPASGAGADALLFRHVLLGGAALLLAVGALWAMNRSRRDHESLGLLALALGLAWSVALLLTGESGYRLALGGRVHAATRAAAAAMVPASATAPPAEPDPEAKAPMRALDYAALEAIHAEPVKSMAHGGRWIRAWASPEAAAAYRAGQPLPLGALVVISSVEDRWGRPGPDGGPLYALEMKASGPSLTFYWPRVPLDRRRESGGESRAYWRGDDTHLNACRRCHGEGMADPAQRSRWRVKKALPGE
ncbi:MAG: hypothetical protein Q8K67_06035 [Geothrix sp.]|nr:hypothetical protein [Geothrix sp.]